MEWLAPCRDLLLTLAALRASSRLFQDHRAPSVGFLLLAASAGLGLLSPAWRPSLQTEARWAAEVLAPALVSFHLLWLSEDRPTALMLLCGPCLLLALGGGLSEDSLALLTRGAGLAALSCSLTVWLFAGSAVGAVGSVCLSLPSLLSAGSPGSGAASEGLEAWLLKLSLSVGCWTSARALPELLSHLSDRCGPGL